MPNWVRNIVRVPKNIMPKIKEKYFTEKGLSFDKVIPMPKELRITSGSVTEDSIAFVLANMSLIEKTKILSSIDEELLLRYNTNNIEDLRSLEKCAERFEPTEEEKELGIKTLQDFGELCISNYQKYGAFNWYNWSVEHWGTKWDASFIGCDETTMEFDTAWSTPVPIFKVISKEFSDEKIRVEYADEDIYGENRGVLVFKNGIIINEDAISTKYANEIWGFDEEEEIDL